MDGGKCILQLRGVRPFYSDKYDVTQHPHYKETAEYNKKNAYDIAKKKKWNLTEEDKPRELLQTLGTSIIREKLGKEDLFIKVC